MESFPAWEGDFVPLALLFAGAGAPLPSGRFVRIIVPTIIHHHHFRRQGGSRSVAREIAPELFPGLPVVATFAVAYRFRHERGP